MKKHLIAAAVAAAVAVPAAAQVTVYGNLNAGITVTRTELGAVKTTATTQGSEDQTSTSVFGFRGTEDLGGGLKAFFDLQADINPGNGQVGVLAYDAVGGDIMFNRLAFVGIEGGFGRISFGRVADAVDSLEGYANHYNLFDTETAGANGIGGKNANSTRYDSPKFMGANIIATYSSNAVGGAGGATNANNAVRTLGVTFSQGALSLGAATGEAAVGAMARGGKVNTVYAGYNLGIADLRIQNTSDEAAAAAGATPVKFSTNEVSALVPLGAGMSVVFHFEDADFNGTNGASTLVADYKQWGVMAKKDLSKRTHAYAGYRSTDRAGAASTDTTITTVGIAHSF